jgi:CRP-like cAMP-binding protein
MDLCKCLQAHHLFSSLSPTQLAKVCQDARWVSLKRNQFLFNQGQPADAFYYLREGQIKLVLLSPSGDEKILEIINPGELFGEAIMFAEESCYPLAAQAMRNASLIQIDYADFQPILEQSSAACLSLLEEISGRLQDLIHEIYTLTLSDASCRVAGYLLAQNQKQGPVFELDIPKIALASRLSVKPETFSRIIKQLSTSELIAINNKQVTILDEPSLRTLTESCSRLESCQQRCPDLNT